MRFGCLALKLDMAHRNIPIFIPHLGCPNQCVFCNQRSISGCREFREEDVREQIERALSTVSAEDEAQIAFFGGSFTGIDRSQMIRLLDLAQSYVCAGRVSSIRLSTRPDYIDSEILEILSRYSVREIELGLQSMDDAVLSACRRGHTAAQAEQACRAVVEAGFTLVGQMMIGLPGADPESEIETAEKICALGASACRIYPTVVFYDTPLCEMVRKGSYIPLELSEAVKRSADVLRVFRMHGVRCIRLGLCASDGLTDPDTVMAGPNHPALGEMVYGELAYASLRTAVEQAGLCGKDLVLHVPEREVSRVVGQHRQNILRLERETNTRIKKIVGDTKATQIIPIEQQEENLQCI